MLSVEAFIFNAINNSFLLLFQKIDGVALDQIGFYKPPKLPCNPILVKTLFTVMFWITMRQFCQERWERKQTSALSDMAAPLRVSVSTASGNY